jgi:hypothetical protein
MAMASHSDCGSTNRWALLVPKAWATKNASVTGTQLQNNYRIKLTRPFKAVASCIVDQMIMSNSAIVSDTLPVRGSCSHNYYSFDDDTKIRRTPEGCRMRMAPLRKSSQDALVFAKMCLY